LSFEVKEKDLLGRIGKLKTKSGTLETPLLFPVINPSIQLIEPQRLKEEFGFEAVITNAYILWKRYRDRPAEEGLRRFLKYDGSVMTDSGAYQILVYGNVEVTQAEIVDYQERIGSDIATILDIPTGWHVPKEYAKQTVAETLKRAKAFFKLKTRDDTSGLDPSKADGTWIWLRNPPKRWASFRFLFMLWEVQQRLWRTIDTTFL
jgi:7-cyano-7-deazaguanine tRNA-ribosyltransferase